MDLQAILDRFEFRPEPTATLTESVEDLRAAARVLGDAIDEGAGTVDRTELDSALRISRDRIETCYGIIAAHGFEGPIVEGTTEQADDTLVREDIQSVLADGSGPESSLQAALRAAFDAVTVDETDRIIERIEADRLALLGAVPERLPDPGALTIDETAALRRALLLVAGTAYLLTGFGMHPTNAEPDAGRIYGGFWLLAAVRCHEE